MHTAMASANMSAQTQAQSQQGPNHQTMSQRELRAFQEWGPSTIHVRSSSPPKTQVQNQNQGQGQGHNQNRGQILQGNSNSNANSNAPKQASQTTHRRRNGRHNRARANSIFDEWKAQATQEDSKRESNGATGDNNIDHKNNNGDASSKNELLSKKETGTGTTGGLPAVSSSTGPASSTVGRSEGQGQAATGKPAAGQPGVEGSRRGKGRRASQAQKTSGAASTDARKEANGKNGSVAASTGAVGSSLSGSYTAADSRSQSGKDVKDSLAHQQSSGAASIDNGLKKVSGQENNAVDSAGLSAGSSGLPASSTAGQHSVASGAVGAKASSQQRRGRKDSRARQQSSASVDNETKKMARNGDSGHTGFPGPAPVSSTASRPDNQPAAVAGPRSQLGKNRKDSHTRQKHEPTSTANEPKNAQEKDVTTSAGAPLNSTFGPSVPHSSAGQSTVLPGSEKANGRSQSEKNGKDTRQGVTKSTSAKDESKKSVNSKNSSTNASASSSARSSYSAPVTSTVGRSGGLLVSEEAKARSQSKMNDKNARQEAPESVSTNGELKNAVSSKESGTATSANSSATSTVGRSEGQPVVADPKKPGNRSQTGSGKKYSHSRQESGSKNVVNKENIAGSPDGPSNTLPAGPIAVTTGSRSQSGTDEKGAHVHQKPEYVFIEEKKFVGSKNRSAAAVSTRLSANVPSFVPGSPTFGHPHGHQPGAAPGSRERDSRSQLRSKDAGQGTSASISTENASKEAVSTKESGVAIAGSLNSTTDCPRVQPTVSSVGSDSAENCSQPEDDWKDCRTCQDSGSVPTDDAPKKVASSKESGTAASVSSSAGFSNLSSVRSSTCQSEGQLATVAGSEGQKNCPQSGKDKENAHQGSSEKGGSYNSKLTGYNIGYDKLTWPFPDQAQKNKACPLPPKPNIESINRRVSTSPDKKSERRVQYSAQDVRSLDYQAPSGAFLNSNQLARLSEGVKMPPKHTVYFLPSFVEDPWKGLKSVEIGCLSRFW